MTDATYCGGCGEPAEIVEDSGYGACCYRLPNPWHRGADGLYNQESPSPEAEDYDEDETSVPRCDGCGSTLWRVSTSETVDTSEYDEGIDTIHYSLENGVEVECADCGRPSRYAAEYG